MDRLIKTFLELAEIDEMYPHEDKVLAYIEAKLKDANVSFTRGEGALVARIPGKTDEAIGFSGHVDIAAPLRGRKVIVEDDIIKTDGTSLLGGDDKTAVAAFLELATELHQSKSVPQKTIEFIFTVGEEAGLMGAKALDVSRLIAKEILVFDWLGCVNSIVTESPAYYKIDIEFIGKDAHPAEWQEGRNAGRALMEAASGLSQGAYSDDIIFNIGIVNIGNARNKVPGHAELQAELRGFDATQVKDAAEEIAAHFREVAAKYKVEAKVITEENAPSMVLDQTASLYQNVVKTLDSMGLQPEPTTTYGCFDGNVFAGQGFSVLAIGAGYYHPHSPDELVKISEFTEMYDFIKAFVGA